MGRESFLKPYGMGKPNKMVVLLGCKDTLNQRGEEVPPPFCLTLNRYYVYSPTAFSQLGLASLWPSCLEGIF